MLLAFGIPDLHSRLLHTDLLELSELLQLDIFSRKTLHRQRPIKDRRCLQMSFPPLIMKSVLTMGSTTRTYLLWAFAAPWIQSKPRCERKKMILGSAITNLNFDKQRPEDKTSRTWQSFNRFEARKAGWKVSSFLKTCSCKTGRSMRQTNSCYIHECCRKGAVLRE